MRKQKTDFNALDQLSLAGFFPSVPDDWEMLGQIPEQCLGRIFIKPGTAVPEAFSGKTAVLGRGRLALAFQRELSTNLPDAFLWFDRITSLEAVRLWLKLFRLVPDTLLIVALHPGSSRNDYSENLILRLGLWLRVV